MRTQTIDPHSVCACRSWLSDRIAAVEWYETVLGLSIQKEFEFWAKDGGPLTLENQAGSVHLALFESGKAPSSTVAFGVSGEQFIEWKEHLENSAIKLRVSDHTKAWSMYFSDPFENLFEITSYDFEYLISKL
jgi:catechol-2,3-dioxygenase